MTTVEALRVYSIDNEQATESRYCGLILPELMPSHECASLDEQDLIAFDNLSELADGGIVLFRDCELRIDEKLENGNLIRSVIEIKDTDDLGNVWGQSANHIQHSNGNNYFEIHPCMISPNGKIWEPEQGSDLVATGTFNEMILLGLIANEATTLPDAA